MNNDEIMDAILKKMSKSNTTPKLGTMPFSELARYFDPISAKDERKLLEIVKSPDSSDDEIQRAKNMLVLSNLRYIIRIATAHQRSAYDEFIKNNPEARDDIILAGIAGILKAIEKFDMERGNRLLSYANSWIKQFASKESRPSSVYSKHVSDYIKEDESNKSKYDEQITKDYASRVAAEEAEKRLKELIMKYISQLDKNEAEMLILYYGLNDHRRHTVEEISALNRSSRERIRQSISNAFEHLRNIMKNSEDVDIFIRLIEIMDDGYSGEIEYVSDS